MEKPHCQGSRDNAYAKRVTSSPWPCVSPRPTHDFRQHRMLKSGHPISFSTNSNVKKR